jgi:hypothetical protein
VKEKIDKINNWDVRRRKEALRRAAFVPSLG